ncbi:hypothetical protein DUI87_08343 [Hirundo rustica rustica]|uniref:Uncharacterized protein n=1 Tax=Hirundo rustica rustica TaxID=333673 RepID=A0A3M0KTX9_HIRRU|nr:hypothetical protein DUI87_08343 [Hirundo rustica rustica]
MKDTILLLQLEKLGFQFNNMGVSDNGWIQTWMINLKLMDQRNYVCIEEVEIQVCIETPRKEQIMATRKRKENVVLTLELDCGDYSTTKRKEKLEIRKENF